MREAVMSGFKTRGRRDHAQEQYDFRFIVGQPSLNHSDPAVPRDGRSGAAGCIDARRSVARSSHPPAPLIPMPA
jgi:hypothetical protein